MIIYIFSMYSFLCLSLPLSLILGWWVRPWKAGDVGRSRWLVTDRNLTQKNMNGCWTSISLSRMTFHISFLISRVHVPEHVINKKQTNCRCCYICMRVSMGGHRQSAHGRDWMFTWAQTCTENKDWELLSLPLNEVTHLTSRGSVTHLFFLWD